MKIKELKNKGLDIEWDMIIPAEKIDPILIKNTVNYQEMLNPGLDLEKFHCK